MFITFNLLENALTYFSKSLFLLEGRVTRVLGVLKTNLRTRNMLPYPVLHWKS